MGFWSRIFGRAEKRSAAANDGWFDGTPWSAHATSGVEVNQTTALNATTVLACVFMLCEDFSKLTPTLYRRNSDGSADKASPVLDHEVSPLLYTPNDWQNWPEFAEMMQASLVMRGNAYAVKIRDRRGAVKKLIPVNADWCAIWEAPDGSIWYRVTPNGLHMMAELHNEPFLIPQEDVLHIRGFSLNGLVGSSRIVLGKEAIGLALGYERQGAQWMGSGASPSGVLQTDQKLSDDASKRMAADWKSYTTGLQNAGKVLVLEQGLKYAPMGMTAVTADYINGRNFQIGEATRLFRIPPHMIGDLQRSNGNSIEQLGQEYVNLTMTGYTNRWAWKLDTDFSLRKQGLIVDFDLTLLTRANQTARFNNYSRAISGGFWTQNDTRRDDGKPPIPGGDVLLTPSNMSGVPSHASGSGAEGGGRPEDGSADQSTDSETAK